MQLTVISNFLLVMKYTPRVLHVLKHIHSHVVYRVLRKPHIYPFLTSKKVSILLQLFL